MCQIKIVRALINYDMLSSYLSNRLGRDIERRKIFLNNEVNIFIWPLHFLEVDGSGCPPPPPPSPRAPAGRV